MIQVADRLSPDLARRECLDNQQWGSEREQGVRVIIVDAHVLLCEALQRVIESFPQMYVTTSPNRIKDVLALLRQEEINVLLLGSSLGACDCLEYVKAARQARPALGIVVVQQQLHSETAFPLIRSGVQGLLGEDASVKDLARAITAAAAGSTFLGYQAREILNDYVTRIPLHFTQREMQVLPLLCLGLSNFCIAQRLALKEKTVEKHLTHIYEKLHIHSRTEAMLRLQMLNL